MNTEEREISLLALLVYVAKGWRSILLWMLLMAIAVGGIQYARESKNARELQTTQPASGEEQREQAVLTLEQLRQEMSEEEVKAVEKVVRLEKEYDQQLDYIQSSMLMTMNPYNVSIARLQYWVDTDYEVNYAGITPKDMTQDIVDSYSNRIKDSGWREKALEAADAATTLAYFGELVTVADTGNSFTVMIKYTDEESLREIVTILEEELQSYQDEITEVFGEHKLSLVNESVEVTVDTDIYNIQQTRKNTLLNLENNIAGYKNAFNDNQKSLYAGEILINEEEAEDETGAEEELSNAEPVVPQVRAKYILLGAVLGAFLVCMLRAMLYILSGRLKAEDNIEGYLGIAGLGCIEENPKEEKGAFGRLDAWIDGLAKRNFADLSKEEQLKMIASNISLYCEKGDMKHIYLNSSINGMQEKTVQLVELLAEKGIEVKEGFSILRDAKAMEDMSRSDGVVFIEQAGKSYYEDLEREIKLCREHQKTIIGLVVLV